MGRNSFWVFGWFRYINIYQVYVSALIVFVGALTTQLVLLLQVAIYDVRSSHIVSIRTGLKSRSIWYWSAVIRTTSESRSSLYVNVRANGKRPRTCSRISVHYPETSYDTCRGGNGWPLIGSKFAKNSWKLYKAYKTRRTWPFQDKNRYNVTLANRRAPGVWLVLGFRTYVFLAPRWPGIPVLAKKTKWT